MELNKVLANSLAFCSLLCLASKLVMLAEKILYLCSDSESGFIKCQFIHELQQKENRIAVFEASLPGERDCVNMVNSKNYMKCMQS